MKSRVKFRFYEELNKHLSEERRKVWFDYLIPDATSVEEVFKDLKIPPDEIDLILVNQESKGLDYRLHDGDRVSVYPEFESFDISELGQLRDKSLRVPRFVCDVHLGRLCKYLRMLGWDTLYSNRYHPDELAAISRNEKRILLTRNYRLTKRSELTHAYCIRSANPREQLSELISKLQLSGCAKPLTRCLNCNQLIVPVDRHEISDRLQERTATYYNEFYFCRACDQVYWKGSHYENMMNFINHVLQF